MHVQRCAAKRDGKVSVRAGVSCWLLAAPGDPGWGLLLAAGCSRGPWPVLMSLACSLFIPRCPHSDFSPLPPRSLLLSKDIKHFHVAILHVCLNSAIAGRMTAVKFCLGQSPCFPAAVNTCEDEWPSTPTAGTACSVCVWGLLDATAMLKERRPEAVGCLREHV